MMQCPACKTTYTDETLRFCLADGTALTAVREEEPTLVRPAGQNPLRVDIPSRAQTPASLPAIGSSGRVIKVILAVLLLGFLAIVAAGLAGFFYFYNSGKSGTVTQNKSEPSVSPKSSPTPDDEKARLREELANLQKEIEEQKKSRANNNPFPTPDTRSVPTARVNSPGDGFLALRSEPDAEYGERLAKIPHGTVIEINNCEKKQVTIGGRSGRWCLVTYGDYAGYVFDAWLIY